MCSKINLASKPLFFDGSACAQYLEGFFPPPNSASYGQGKSHSNLDMAYFFTKECGSISRSSARCSIYTVDINIDEPSLSLHPGFISAIKDIDNAVTSYDKKIVMKKFIERFGTHFAKESITVDLPEIHIHHEDRYKRNDIKLLGSDK